jgi:hypothetical protein
MPLSGKRKPFVKSCAAFHQELRNFQVKPAQLSVKSCATFLPNLRMDCAGFFQVDG